VLLRPLGLVLALATLLQAISARSQNGDELAAARKLFGQAVADEDEGRYDTALEKFQRVEAVKDTANVRYRIATCLENLGRRAEALSNYEEAVRLAEGDKTAAEAARASAARIEQLDRVVPRLTVVLPPDAPPDTEVRVDDLPLGADALRNPMPLDPGHHTIAANALGRAPYRTGVTLPEGGAVTITVALQPLVPPTPADAAAPPDASATVPEPPPPPASTGSSPLAIGMLGLGGALAVGSVVSFVLSKSNIDTMKNVCANPPTWVIPQPTDSKLECPDNRTPDINNTRSTAVTEQTVGWGLAAGAAAAVGVGVWLLLRPAPTNAPPVGVRIAPVVSQKGGMLVVSGPLPR
jgi:hypothetical protein